MHLLVALPVVLGLGRDGRPCLLGSWQWQVGCFSSMVSACLECGMSHARAQPSLGSHKRRYQQVRPGIILPEDHCQGTPVGGAACDLLGR